MIVKFENNKTVLCAARDFELEPVFECGQCFRFDKIQDGYEGVALGSYLHVSKAGSDVTLYPCSKQDYLQKWKNYFDLNRDYACLFPGGDSVLQESLRFGRGLRAVNQPPFETLISFIISANNNVKRIRGIIRGLCGKYGKPFSFQGRTFFDFPEPKALAGAQSADLKQIGAGYRAPFISGAARMVEDGFDLEALRSLEYSKAKRELMRLPGVGPKVADCVLLFSLGHSRAFPADVWIKRVLDQEYGFKGNDKQTAEFALHQFGKHAGIAGQYLFFWIRGRENA